MDRLPIAVIAGLVTMHAYSLDAAAAPTTSCPLLAPGTAIGEAGGSLSGSLAGDPDSATRNEDETPMLIVSPAGGLSIDVTGISLDCILRELGRQGEIYVRIKGPPIDEPLSLTFRDLPLYQGVRLLLRGKSYILEHAWLASVNSVNSVGNGPAAERMVAIRVMRTGRRGFELVPAALEAVPAEAEPPPSAGTEPPPAEDEEPTPEDRAAALMELADKNKAQLQQAILWAIEDTGLEEDEFWEIVIGVDDWTDDHAPAEVLAAAVRGAPTPADRVGALALVSEISEELSFEDINQAIEDPDPQISGLAAELFRDLRTDALSEAIAAALEDEDRQVRSAALDTLDNMHEYAPVGQVAALAASDPAPQVRMKALELITYGDPHEAMGPLSEALDDKDPKVRDLAAMLMDEMMDELDRQQQVASN